VLRRIFGPKRDEVTGEWRKLHNEELCDLYSSPSIIRMIKSRRTRWGGHVARMRKKRKERKGKERKGKERKGKSPLRRYRRRWKIILKRVLEKLIGVVWSGLMWLRIGTSGGLL
jgi:hypothetical protein